MYTRLEMEVLTQVGLFIFYILMFLLAIFLSVANFRYFKTMWRYKNRKKDGSEDDQFKKFD
jgi:hypothetical protein